MQALYYKTGATRARIQKLESTKLAEVKVSEYRHKKYKVALRRLAQISNNDRKARPPAWEPPNYSWSKGELDVVDGIGDLHVAVVGIGDLYAPGLQRRLQRPIRQNSKGNKSSEYLIYPRVLCPATKLLCMYQMERGGCIVDCKIENTRIRGNMLGLSKTSIFRRVLQHGGRISQQFIST